MKVAACQLPDIRNDTERALALVVASATDAQERGARLVTYPECFLQGYEVEASYVANAAIDLSSLAFDDMLHRLAALEPVIVLGLIEKDASKFYNMAVVIDRGRLVTRYRKTHLIDSEQAVFQAGIEYPIFDVDGVKVGINICYDLTFAESSESAVRAGAQLLACPCNNMLRLPNAENWKYRHNEIRCQRARDAQVWILSADVTGERDGRISYGPTAMIDPGGGVVAQVPLMTTGMLVTDLFAREFDGRRRGSLEQRLD